MRRRAGQCAHIVIPDRRARPSAAGGRRLSRRRGGRNSRSRAADADTDAIDYFH